MRLLLGNLLIILIIFTGCSKEESQKRLLIYCGMTMAKPMNALKEKFEKSRNVEIEIIIGASKDLYESLRNSRVGDLYLPGSSGYRVNNLDEGLLGGAVLLGYNRPALIVKKGNPKEVKGNLEVLLDGDLKIALCNPDSGSIGKISKGLLEKVGIYNSVYERTEFLTVDSKNLTEAVKSGKADVVINWYATTQWDENRDLIEAIEITGIEVPKKELLLNELTFSQNPKIVKEFLKFASSKEGLETFKKYGF